MKVGDIVKMHSDHGPVTDGTPEDWGMGIVLSVNNPIARSIILEVSPLPSYVIAGVEILWGSVGINWQTDHMLEVISRKNECVNLDILE